jgi:hypothetical protein
MLFLIILNLRISMDNLLQSMSNLNISFVEFLYAVFGLHYQGIVDACKL